LPSCEESCFLDTGVVAYTAFNINNNIFRGILWSWIDILVVGMGSDAATKLGILGLGIAESFGKENIAVELASTLKELFPKATFLRCVVILRRVS
jgi:hypothetical protein